MADFITGCRADFREMHLVTPLRADRDKTCQLLLEGNYNGILKADEHYIAIRKDLSNIDKAIARFRDTDHRTRIAERAYDFVMAEHTYRHRVEKLLRTVTATVRA